MPIDRKYGKLTFDKPNAIREDEPVVVFRAQDCLLLDVLGYYMGQCAVAGSPQKHLDAIHSSIERVRRYQTEHTSKVPD